MVYYALGSHSGVRKVLTAGSRAERLKANPRFTILTLVATDLLLAGGIFVLSIYIVSHSGVFHQLPRPASLSDLVEPYGYELILLLLTLGLCAVLFELYRDMYTQGYLEQAVATFRIVAVTYAAWLLLLYLLHRGDISRLLVGVSWLGTTGVLVLWRLALRWYVRRMMQLGPSGVNILIYGAGRIGKLVASEMQRLPELGLHPVGFLDDDKPAGTETEVGLPVLGRFENVDEAVKHHFVKEIYVTVPSNRRLVTRLLAYRQRGGVAVKIVPDLHDLSIGEMMLTSLGSLPLLVPRFSVHRLGVLDLTVKRLIDVLGAVFLLLLAVPLMLAVAIAIRLEDGVPVLYRALRAGRHGKPFQFYKFRSMRPDADLAKDALRLLNQQDGPIFKVRDDPRLTRVGRLIRRYSIDELPQLWNVLRGDMSLVGPRPPLPEEVEKYGPEHMERLSVRPGMTSLYVVAGRSDLTFEEWMRLDLYYIRNWSLTLDLRILLKSVPRVLRGDGAY